MTKLLLTTLCIGLGLSACSPAEEKTASPAAAAPAVAAASAPAVVDPNAPLDGTELHGKTIRMEQGGVVTRTSFSANGTATTTSNGNPPATTPFKVDGAKLCFDPITGTTPDCWPYEERLEPGRTYDITSPNGRRVKVTLEN